MPDTLDFVHTSGGVIAPSILAEAVSDTSRQQVFHPGTFAYGDMEPPKPKEHAETIEASFEMACEQYDKVAGRLDELELPELRRLWLLPLMQILDLAPAFKRGKLPSKDGRDSFAISHLGWEDDGAPPILLVKQDLDLAPERRRRAPHDELQQYLNASEPLWGIVANGRRLRILRDYYHTKLKAFVGFDLDAIFESRDFPSFRALYRLAHRSRFIPNENGKLPLEALFEASQEQGVQIGRTLQKQVRAAIEALADGLLDENVRRELTDAEKARGAYHELLLVVYRILFLLFAEQRRMLPTEGIYAETYSITALARLADSGTVERHHEDLWEGLKITFQMLHKGAPEIGVYPYNGQLFDIERTATFMDRACRNENIIKAIHALTYVRLEGVRQRVNYAELGVEELGSVYESLLNYTLKVAEVATTTEDWIVPEGHVFLSPLTTERKDLGAFYTRPELVDFVLSISLDRLIQERLESAGKEHETRVKSLLDIRVCDPACGSGAFLVGAIDRLALAVATERSEGNKPSEDALQVARRDVLRGCIYGVDKDRFAVELCKVALWIHCAVPDMPLSFLDHRIQHGDSLVGWPLLEIPTTIPKEAFNVPSKVGSSRKAEDVQLKTFLQDAQARNNDVLEGAGPLFRGTELPDVRVDFPDIMTEDERVPADVQRKNAAYTGYLHSDTYERFHAAANLWTAAFFWSPEANAPAPTTANYQRALQGEVSADMATAAEQILQEFPAFHWPLRFPEIRARDGFDCMIGNPPWEQFENREEEFFAAYAPEIGLLRGERRKAAIGNLDQVKPEVGHRWRLYERANQRIAEFSRGSGRYTRTGGKPNTYLLFTELSADNMARRGRAGIIVKSALGLEKSATPLFQKLVEGCLLEEFHDFVNGGGIYGPKIFQAPNEHVRFCVVSLSNARETRHFDYTSLNWTIDEAIIRPRVHIGPEDLSICNPISKTLLSYRTSDEFEIAQSLHCAHQLLDCDEGGENPWQLEYMTLFNSSTASKLFLRREELEENGWILDDDKVFRKEASEHNEVTGEQAELTFESDRTEEAWPIYEGQLVTRYDHRPRTYAGITDLSKKYGKKPGIPETSADQKAWPDFEIEPRYWMLKTNAKLRLDHKIKQRIIIGFRDVAVSFADSRCAKGAMLPRYPATDTVPIFALPKERALEFLGYFNSITFDFLVRGHMPSNHVKNLWMLAQVPMPDFGEYPEIADLSRRLSLTSNSVAAQFDLPVHPWNPEERYSMDTELDARVAHAYGLTYAQYETVFDSFEVLARLETREHGRFKYKEDCLKAYRRFG